MMKGATLFVVRIATAAALLSASHQAFAQANSPWRPERPNRALFGGGGGSTEQSLVVTASAGAARERINFTVPDEGADGRLRADVTSGSASGNMNYTLNRATVGFDATGGVSSRFVGAFDQPLVSENAALSGRWQAARSTTVTGTFTVGRQPLSLSSVFPGAFGSDVTPLLPTESSLGIDQGEYFHRDTRVEVRQALSRRSTLTASYNYGSASFRTEDQSQSSQTFLAGFTQQLSRGLGVRLGISQTVAAYDDSAVPGEQRLQNRTYDVGLDFSKALSFSRRTTLSIRTGSAALSYRGQTRYWVTGTGSLSRELGRTWNTSLTYSRQVDFTETLRLPSFAETVTVGLGGLFTRRLSFSASSGAARGQFGFSQTGGGYLAYHSGVALTIGLTRSVGARLQYSYDRYTFDGGAAPPAALPPQLRRHALRATIDVWAPLFQRSRRANAAR